MDRDRRERHPKPNQPNPIQYYNPNNNKMNIFCTARKMSPKIILEKKMYIIILTLSFCYYTILVTLNAIKHAHIRIQIFLYIYIGDKNKENMNLKLSANLIKCT